MPYRMLTEAYEFETITLSKLNSASPQDILMRAFGRSPLIRMIVVSVSIVLLLGIAEAQEKWDQHARNTSERKDPSFSPYEDQTPEEETSILTVCLPFAVVASVLALWIYAKRLEKKEEGIPQTP